MLSCDLKGNSCGRHICSWFCCLLSVILIGCVKVKEYRRVRPKVSTSSPEGLDLKGMSKNDVVHKLGRPLAVSESGVSESWYYTEPCETWVWFDKDGKVKRWEIK